MVISKLDAARIQLDSAIDHYFQGDHVCAVTLAGAAEDIFAGLLKASGQQTPFEFLHDWYQENYNTTVSKNDFSRRIANLGRNWLKHAEEDADTKFDITEGDSIMMLMRALPCYQKLTKSQTEKMKKFSQYLKTNITRINKLFF
jgi:hypothetical protein